MVDLPTHSSMPPPLSFSLLSLPPDVLLVILQHSSFGP